jgi:hypothetical protein
VGIARCGCAWREKSDSTASIPTDHLLLSDTAWPSRSGLFESEFRGIEFRGIELAKHANDRDVVFFFFLESAFVTHCMYVSTRTRAATKRQGETGLRVSGGSTYIHISVTTIVERSATHDTWQMPGTLKQINDACASAATWSTLQRRTMGEEREYGRDIGDGVV